MLSNQQIGLTGEALARDFLAKKGYQIVSSNVRTRYGEIDIIAKDKDYICFVEVKMRHSKEQGHPLEAITPSKIKSLSKAALGYLQANHLIDHNARFDVVGISVGDGASYRFEHVENAFEIAY